MAEQTCPGSSRELTDAVAEKVVTRTLQTNSTHANHFNTCAIVKATGLSQSTVSCTRQTFAVEHHQTEAFKLSNDVHFVVGQDARLADYRTVPASERHDDLEDEPEVSQTARHHEQMEKVVDTEDIRPEGGPA